jgi:high-affinity Fe2+/Pb2+ permease
MIKMDIGTRIKRLAMWFLFFVQPYGAPLQKNGNERQIPLGIAIFILLVCSILIGLLFVGLYGWLIG